MQSAHDAARACRLTVLYRIILSAAVIGLLSGVLHAQPAPNAQPRGGTVSAGLASIDQTARATVVTQSSPRAIVDWRSFDVGRDQNVQFAQPSSSAVTLNRVNSTSPSQIAGSINANGQVVIVNQSGVVVSKGAQINAQSLVISAAGITGQNFMAGKMVFDQAANANARVRNDGTITVRQAGLAALVAPQVVNNGVIRATLGKVVLAGVQRQTLDLYGDGLLAIDVTSQVRQAPVGADGKAATSLVTNNGLISAAGGTILLTASAADGVVQNLVTANGRVYADTIGGRTGTVVISGTGGSVQVLGSVRSAGRMPGTVGGQIEVNAGATVNLAGSARIDASGPAGGGVIALGTTLARAKGGNKLAPALMAASTRVASGATIAADALVRGNGGRIAVLSQGTTSHQGRITARGGADGGDGGHVELSGAQVALGGSAIVAAPRGTAGSILLDPLDLYVLTGGVESRDSTPIAATPHASAPNVAFADQPGQISFITPAQISLLTGNVDLQATRDVLVYSPITTAGGLTLEAGRNLTVEAGASLTTSGNIMLKAAEAEPGVLTVNGVVQSNGLVYLSGENSGNGLQVTAPVFSTRPAALGGPLISVACDCFINATSGGSLEAPGGTVEIGPRSDGLAFNIGSTANVIAAKTYRFGQTHDPVTGNPGPLAGDLTLGTAAVAYDFHGLNLELDTAGGIVQFAGSSLQSIGTLSGKAGTSAIFASPANSIAGFGSFTAGSGSFVANDSMPLTVSGPIVAGGNIALTTPAALTIGAAASLTGGAVTLQSGTGGMRIAGTVAASGGAQINSTGDITQSGNALIVARPGGAINLTTGGDLAQTGTAQIIGDTVAIRTGGTLQQSGSALIATVPDGAINTVAITTGGDITQTGSSAIRAADAVSVAAGGNLTQSGTTSIQSMDTTAAVHADANLAQSGSAAIRANTLTVSAGGGIAQSENAALQATGTLALAAGTTITQTGGSITAGALTGRAAGALLTAPQNRIADLDAFTTTGAFTLTDSIPVAVSGTVTVGAGQMLTINDNQIMGSPGGALNAPGGIVALAPATTGADLLLTNFVPADVATAVNAQTLHVGSASAGNITINGLFNLPGVQVLDLRSGGEIIETANAGIGVAELTGSASSATLNGANTVGTLAGFATTGGFSFNATQGLTITGAVNGRAGLSLTVKGPLALGAADAPATLTSSGTVTLAATGIAEPNGSITAATLAGNGGASAMLNGPNSIAALGGFQTTGNLVLNDTRSLTVAGPVAAGPSTAINAQGDIVLTGDVSAGTLALTATGALTQTGGVISADTLTGGAMSANLAGANTIGALAGFATTGGFSLSNIQPLTITGAVNSGAGLSLSATGPLTLGTTATPGTLTSSGTVTLAATGIAEPNGSITAATLTGNGGASAMLNGPNSVATLGGFQTTGNLVLNDAAPLTISGPLSASFITVQAPGSINLAGDVAVGAGTAGAVKFIVNPDPNGQATFAQTGTTHVTSLTGSDPALEIDNYATNSSTLSFNNLVAPEFDLVIQLQGGRALGTVDVKSLFVHGFGGSANFTHSMVSGESGPAAALAAQYALPGSFVPMRNPAYQLNGCMIGSITCGHTATSDAIAVSTGVSSTVASLLEAVSVAPPQGSQQTSQRGIPLVNPMRDLANGPLHDRQDDPDLLLPNVSEKDY